jgi:hypothetical protein
VLHLHILNLASNDWLVELGLSWLRMAPKNKLLPEIDRRKPFPLNWVEQDKLVAVLPVHLPLVALFTVNTGCRDQEFCNLSWEWVVATPKLKTYLFIVPAWRVKNRQDRKVVLNTIAT